MATRVASASKRSSSTTRLPASSAPQHHTAGPLWYSGPGMTRHPPSTNPKRFGASGSSSAGSPATMSLGRPVEPPDVGAFQAGDTASGSGPSSSSAGVRYPSGRQVVPASVPGSAPSATFEPARATISASSRAGSFADTGWGTAPSF